MTLYLHLVVHIELEDNEVYVVRDMVCLDVIHQPRAVSSQLTSTLPRKRHSN